MEQHNILLPAILCLYLKLVELELLTFGACSGKCEKEDFIQ